MSVAGSSPVALVKVAAGHAQTFSRGPIEHCPGFAALADALDRHAGAAAGALMRAPFALGDQAQLRELVEAAAFIQIRIRPAAGTVRFASARDLVLAFGSGSPLAAHLAGVDDGTRDALVIEVESALRPWTNDTGLSFRIEALLLAATTP